MQLNVNGQTIAWADAPFTVSGTEGVYKVAFTFEDAEGLPEWSSLTKYAVFKNTKVPEYADGVYAEIVDGEAEIPACVLVNPGDLYVGVLGQSAEKSLPTIWACPVKIVMGCGEPEEAGAEVMTQAQNAIKYGENSKVYAEGGYLVIDVEQTAGDPVITRSSDYTKGSKEYASDAAAAQTAAETAQGKAEDAQTAAETAQGKAEDAQGAAETAQGKAEDAQSAAEASATEAESYAKGGTNTRSGEDTDNAKYYKEQAGQSAQNAAQSASAAEGFKDQAAAYAAAAQSVVDSNFLLVDKDDNDKKYLVMMYVEDGDFCVDFEDFVE